MGSKWENFVAQKECSFWFGVCSRIQQGAEYLRTRSAVYHLPASPAEMAGADLFLENILYRPEHQLNGKGKHPVAHLMSLVSLLQD